MTSPSTRIPQLISSARAGDLRASEELLPAVYDELRRLAAFLLQREPPGQTLQATSLVHEAFVKVAGGDTPPTFEDRRHFFNTAAEAMRRILVDRYRRKSSEKHGGGRVREDLDRIDLPATRQLKDAHIPFLDEAMRELTDHNPRWGEIVHLRYFAGLTIDETSELLAISPATVKGEWSFASTWLRVRLAQLASA